MTVSVNKLDIYSTDLIGQSKGGSTEDANILKIGVFGLSFDIIIEQAFFIGILYIF